MSLLLGNKENKRVSSLENEENVYKSSTALGLFLCQQEGCAD